MIGTQTPPQRRLRGRNGAAGEVTLLDIREALGRAKYERMRIAMLPDLAIDPWELLSERSREAYREPLDFLVPTVGALLEMATRAARRSLDDGSG